MDGIILWTMRARQAMSKRRSWAMYTERSTQLQALDTGSIACATQIWRSTYRPVKFEEPDSLRRK